MGESLQSFLPLTTVLNLTVINSSRLLLYDSKRLLNVTIARLRLEILKQRSIDS